MRSLYILLGIIIVAGIVYFTQENTPESPPVKEKIEEKAP